MLSETRNLGMKLFCRHVAVTAFEQQTAERHALARWPQTRLSEEVGGVYRHPGFHIERRFLGHFRLQNRVGVTTFDRKNRP